ncbi:hypothetical protein BJ742DRAFT_874226 [Cladochytrium replicatum]|nr:hypothetical protein BJ742DRAFT_874226 [Cladochytrium replicatum]
MDAASREGHLDVIDWWKNRAALCCSGLQLKVTGYEIDTAEAKQDVSTYWINGLTADLNIGGGKPICDSSWQEKKLVEEQQTTDELQQRRLQKRSNSSGNELNIASAGGRVDVLRWWKDSGLHLAWTEAAMDDASRRVLNWWKDSGLKTKTRLMQFGGSAGVVEDKRATFGISHRKAVRIGLQLRTVQ